MRDELVAASPFFVDEKEEISWANIEYDTKDRKWYLQSEVFQQCMLMKNLFLIEIIRNQN